MKLLFRIGYNTAWGESLYLLGSVKELGEWNESKALKMTYEDGIWSKRWILSAMSNRLSIAILSERQWRSSQGVGQASLVHVWKRNQGL